jgi:hypothetical protein
MSYYGTPGVPLISGDVPTAVPLEQPHNLFRYGEQALWSTHFWADGEEIAQGTFRTFNVPLGQVGQGMTRVASIAETNLKVGGRIPNGVAFDCFGIAAQYMAMTSNDGAGAGTLSEAVNANGALLGSIAPMVNLLNSGALSWDFTQTQVDIAPLHLVGAGGGAFGSLAVNNPAAGAGVPLNVGNVNNGGGSIWLYRKHPVALPGSGTFSVLIRFGLRAEAIENGVGDVALRIVLMGYYKNVIEIG